MDPAFIQEYEQFELRHWWHVGRRDIIESFLDHYVTAVPGNGQPRWLDVGCGTGVMLNSYRRIQHKLGVEVEGDCVSRAQAKGLNVVQTPPVWDFSQFGTFDVVTLCDVIEHVERESDALRAVWDVLKPGGIALVTVPAVKSMWSSHDVINHHFRRYDRPELQRLFHPRQWDVLRTSYFCSFLFPLVYAYRRIKNIREARSGSPPRHDNTFGPPLIDKLLYAIFRSERVFLQSSDLPIGSSLILVARKRHASSG